MLHLVVQVPYARKIQKSTILEILFLCCYITLHIEACFVYFALNHCPVCIMFEQDSKS